jgi:hypothetical protein
MNKIEHDYRNAQATGPRMSGPEGAPISLRDPALCKVQKTMIEAGELLREVSLWADKLCGPLPEVPSTESEKYINGFFDGISSDADSLMRRVIEAREALARIRREFP